MIVDSVATFDSATAKRLPGVATVGRVDRHTMSLIRRAIEFQVTGLGGDGRSMVRDIIAGKRIVTATFKLVGKDGKSGPWKTYRGRIYA